jgi:hypothetical protein
VQIDFTIMSVGEASKSKPDVASLDLSSGEIMTALVVILFVFILVFVNSLKFFNNQHNEHSYLGKETSSQSQQHSYQYQQQHQVQHRCHLQQQQRQDQ